VVTKQCTAALLFALLLYSGILPRAKQYQYAALVPREKITAVTGRVVSNPYKTVNFGNEQYRFDFELESVACDSGISGADSIVCSARGVMRVLYPAALIESLYPGKLYSLSNTFTRAGKNAGGDSTPLVDAGIRLKLSGKMTGNFFSVSAAQEAVGENAGAFHKIQKTRLVLRLAFKRVLYAWGNAGGLFLALVTGAREYTEEKLSSLFAAAGLAHVLALSGMHLSIFTQASSKLGKKTGARAGHAVSFITVLLFVWFAGFTPSLRRAFLCFLLQFCAKLCGKRAGMLSVLAAAFVIHSCLFPHEAASVSFMLSYLGLAGILIASQTLQPLAIRAVLKAAPLFACLPQSAPRIMRHVPKKIRALCENAATFVVANTTAGAGAFMATSPVSANVFGFLTPISVVSSVIVSPLVTLFIFTGICCVIITLAVPQSTFAFAKIMDALYRIMLACVTHFANIPPVMLQPER
jgi:competence protein ComEC